MTIEDGNQKPVTVADLIAYLKKLPKDLPVAYERYSEQCLLALDEIYLAEKCLPRPDGWVQHARPDMPTQKYLILPGN